MKKGSSNVIKLLAETERTLALPPGSAAALKYRQIADYYKADLDKAKRWVYEAEAEGYVKVRNRTGGKPKLGADAPRPGGRGQTPGMVAKVTLTAAGRAAGVRMLAEAAEAPAGGDGAQKAG